MQVKNDTGNEFERKGRFFLFGISENQLIMFLSMPDLPSRRWMKRQPEILLIYRRV